MIIQPNDPVQAAMAAEQMAAAQRADNERFIRATAMQVYAQFIANTCNPNSVVYRDLARQAVEAAPYLAEALGMVTLEKKGEAECTD